jgi:hypothetical protein
MKLEAVCELMTIYMLNVTATGHSITQMTDSKLGALLHATVQYVLAQLHVICFKRVSTQGMYNVDVVLENRCLSVA